MAKVNKSVRERMREAANEGVRQSQENTDYKPTSFPSYYDVIGDITEWRPKGDEDGVEHFIDILPFAIGEDFPDGMLKNPRAIKEKGFYHILDLWVHFGIGPANEVVICPQSSFKEGHPRHVKCPICAVMNEKQRNEPDEEERKKIWRSMGAKRRTIYAVVVRDEGEEEAKGVQIYEVAHFYLQKTLDKISKENKRRQGTITYADIDSGKTIKFTITQTGSGTEKKVQYDGIDFEDRVKEHPVSKKLEEYVIEDEFLAVTEELFPETFLKFHSTEEIENLASFYRDNDDGNRESRSEEPTVGSRRNRRSRLERNKVEKEQEEDPNDNKNYQEEDNDDRETGSLEECPCDFIFGKHYLTDDRCTTECDEHICEACQEENLRMKEEMLRKRRGQKKDNKKSDEDDIPF